MFFCLFSGFDSRPDSFREGIFLKSSYRGCWCEETLGGKNKDLHYFILVFFLLPSIFLVLNFLHFAGHDDRVTFSDLLSTKLLVIECAFVLITVSMY